jgi:uncharacterized membrane protein
MADQSGMQYQPYSGQESFSPATINRHKNLGAAERIVSMIGGISTFVFGVTRRRSPLRPVLLMLGSYLGYRGATGFCYISDKLGVSSIPRTTSPQVSVPHGKGIRVDKCVTINRSANDLYLYWRDLENLPRIMHHLESVTVLNGNRSHWVAKAPAGMKVEWDAEIINDVPNQRIGWRSLPGASVPNAGSVVFKPAPEGRTGTEVEVSLKYDPPGGVIGAAVAKLFGEEPGDQLQDDLDHFRQAMEMGEPIASTLRTIERDPAPRNTFTTDHNTNGTNGVG